MLAALIQDIFTVVFNNSGPLILCKINTVLIHGRFFTSIQKNSTKTYRTICNGHFTSLTPFPLILEQCKFSVNSNVSIYGPLLSDYKLKNTTHINEMTKGPFSASFFHDLSHFWTDKYFRQKPVTIILPWTKS